MNALRGVLFLLAQLIATPIALTLMMLAIPLGGDQVYAGARAWCTCMVWVAKQLGLHYHIDEPQPMQGQSVVILAKHSSAWETFFIVSHFRRLVPVVKRELLWVPVFGWGLAMCRPIAIDRSAGREARNQLQDQGIERLGSGLSVMIFPEGTRIPAGQRGRYASGGTALAIAAGVPVVLVAHDAGHLWRKALFDKRAGTVQVRISAPMRPAADESAADFMRRAEDWIETQICSFGHPPAAYTAKALAAAQAQGPRPERTPSASGQEIP